MIITMLVTLVAIVVTGLLAESRTGGAGRFSPLFSADLVKLVGDVHAWLGLLIMWLVGLHVAGVLFESLVHGENLVASMITGRKRAASPNDRSGWRVSLWRTAPILVLLAELGAWQALGTHLPPSQVCAGENSRPG
jgi:hypothetical protein